MEETRQRHKQDDFTTEDKLLEFVQLKPTTIHAIYGGRIKGIFKANRCPLLASFNTTFTRATRKISSGILKAIYDSLPREELRLMIDLQAYAGERVAALCARTPLSQWEDAGDYVLIHIRAEDTKVRHIHVCIIPKGLAERIREYAHQLGRLTPFPNHETLWREITKLALTKFRVRLTSHYLRKRFHTLAGKSGIPVNSADYLMGDKATWGHAADTYTLQDFADLIREYDLYLAPYLSLTTLKEPDDPREPFKNEQLEQLLKENLELKEQILKLTKLLTKSIQV